MNLWLGTLIFWLVFYVMFEPPRGKGWRWEMASVLLAAVCAFITAYILAQGDAWPWPVPGVGDEPHM